MKGEIKEALFTQAFSDSLNDEGYDGRMWEVWDHRVFVIERQVKVSDAPLRDTMDTASSVVIGPGVERMESQVGSASLAEVGAGGEVVSEDLEHEGFRPLTS